MSENLFKTRYLDIDDRTEDLRDLLRHHKTLAHDFSEKFDLSWIFHENGLEGIVITAQDMALAFNPVPIAADSSSLPVLMEIRNHKKAIDAIREEAKASRININLALARKLYKVLGEGIPGREEPVFRKDMPLHRTYFHDIDQPPKIPAHLDKVLAATKTKEFKEDHPIKQAATLQWGFMQVFPFTDNSGKIARLLSNLILIRSGYYPLVIHAIDRQRYYETLRQPVTALRQFLLEAMESTLDNAQKYCREAIRAKARKAI